MSLISPSCLFFSFLSDIYVMFIAYFHRCMFNFTHCPYNLVHIFFCHVHAFNMLFNSWLTHLRFSSSLNFKIYNKLLKTPSFLKEQQQNGSVFSLNVDLKIFLNKKLICIFIKYRSKIFLNKNWFVFSLNADLKFFSK